MSDAPTSGDNQPPIDRLDLGAALSAGWSPQEVEWEVKQEMAANLAQDGDMTLALRQWQDALKVAQESFEPNDPRLGTSLANAAYGLRATGKPEAAQGLFEAARRCWDSSLAWVENLKIERKGRSSLYHMRLEAGYWEQFEANARKRLGLFASEAREAVAILAEGGPPPARTYARWRGEKPPRFSDSRKLLAACLLLVSQ